MEAFGCSDCQCYSCADYGPTSFPKYGLATCHSNSCNLTDGNELYPCEDGEMLFKFQCYVVVENLDEAAIGFCIRCPDPSQTKRVFGILEPGKKLFAAVYDSWFGDGSDQKIVIVESILLRRGVPRNLEEMVQLWSDAAPEEIVTETFIVSESVDDKEESILSRGSSSNRFLKVMIVICILLGFVALAFLLVVGLPLEPYGQWQCRCWKDFMKYFLAQDAIELNSWYEKIFIVLVSFVVGVLMASFFTAS